MTGSDRPPESDAAGPTATEADLRAQFRRAFNRASYPLETPFDLIPVLPDGPATEFAAGDVVVPAVDLGLVHGEHLAFPYESPAALADDVVAALRVDGVLPDPAE